jgi:hypothetical protein
MALRPVAPLLSRKVFAEADRGVEAPNARPLRRRSSERLHRQMTVFPQVGSWLWTALDGLGSPVAAPPMSCHAMKRWFLRLHQRRRSRFDLWITRTAGISCPLSAFQLVALAR